MPNTHETLTSLFSDIADAIREKTGGTEEIVADTFPTAIESIPTGSPRVEIGTFNVPSKVSSLLFHHNLGVVPTIVIAFCNGTGQRNLSGCGLFVLNQGFVFSWNPSGQAFEPTSYRTTPNITDSTVEFAAAGSWIPGEFTYIVGY